MGHNGAIANGEWWRFFTPMFLHAGIMHILFNMFCLFVFGPELEKIIGKMRFLTLYLLSGIFANVATYFLHDWIMHMWAQVARFSGSSVHTAHSFITQNDRCLNCVK